MEGTTSFKQVIKSFLDNKSVTDSLFTPKYASEKKNINDCVTYILNTVEKSGCNGFSDDEIFGMAIHYYDEESIDIGKAVKKGRVVVNHVVSLTPQDVEQARTEAIKKYQDNLILELKNKKSTKVKPAITQSQKSIFDEAENEDSTGGEWAG